MAYCLHEKLKDLKPYEATSGTYEVRLDANESFIDPGERFGDEILEAIRGLPLNRYPDASCKKLRETYAGVYGLNPDSLVAGNGSDDLLALITSAFLKEGEKVLTLSPDFSMYGFYADIYGRENIVLEKEDIGEGGLTATPERILSAMEKHHVAALLFSNPGSPSSTIMKREEVMQVIEGTESLVIVDEAYMDFSDQSVLDLAEKYDNLIVLKTCSKAWGMAGIRLGFAISSPEIVRALNSLRSPYNINALTQAAACAILSHPDYLKECVNAMKQGRDELYRQLMSFSEAGKLGRIQKSHTNFLFAETDRSAEIYQELKKRSIIVRKQGEALRITSGTPEENCRLIAALTEIL